MNIRRTALTTSLAVLLGSSVLGLGGAATAASSDPGGWIRAGHLAPGVGKADIEISPYSGGTTRTLDQVTYGRISPYEKVPAGLYTVAVVPAGQSMAQAMVRQTVRVQDGAASTVFATGKASDVSARVVSDDLTPPPAGKARIRLVSGAGNVSKVGATVVGGPTLAKDAATGSVTGYADIAAQTWTVSVSASGSSGTATSTRAVTVAAGSVYTLLVLDGAGGNGLRLVPTVDSAGAAAMPTGGVETGGGYLAQARHTAALGTRAAQTTGATSGSA